jgi:hypothetical protein
MTKIIRFVFPLSQIEAGTWEFIYRLFGLDREQIQEGLNPLIKHLKKNDLWAFAEYPYVDRDYRSSYYAYFAQKHRDYDRNCIRVSLFEEEIKEEYFNQPSRREQLKKSYRGFFVIRPTIPKIIGRSMISPKAVSDNKFRCLLVTEHSNVHGISLEVNAFPHASQDMETMTCSETTVWETMAYFGMKFPEFRPVLPEEVINCSSEVTFRRSLPSKGMGPNQISYILKEYGLDCEVYSLEEYKPGEIMNFINCYIDSKIPVVTFLGNGKNHAMLIIGTTAPEFRKPPGRSAWKKYGYSIEGVEILEENQLMRKYVIIDDNHPPYQIADYKNPTSYYSEAEWRRCKITAIVVPLHKHIFLEADKAQKLARSVLIGFGGVRREFGTKPLVARMFCAKSRDFKSYIAVNGELNTGTKERILGTSMPRFVWLYEIGPLGISYGQKPMATGLIVLDATEANKLSVDSTLAYLTPKCLRIHSGAADFRKIQVEQRPFERFDPWKKEKEEYG